MQEECKYKIKKKMIRTFITDDVELSSSYDDNDSEGSFDEIILRSILTVSCDISQSIDS